jgi:hypothetical protein
MAREYIKILNNEKEVKIKITIDYIGPSKYIFVVSPGISFNYTTADIPLKPFPHEYNIGKGKDLVSIGNGNNNWTIQLINPSDKDLAYKIYIEWYQEGNDTDIIYMWPQPEKSRQGVVKAHVDHIVFSGNCIYES